MVAVYDEASDSYIAPHTESNDPGEKPKRHRRTKEEMAEARARGEVGEKAPTGRGRSSLRGIITDLVKTVNVALYSVPWTHADALSDDEEKLLIEGLDKAQEVSPTLKRFLQSGSRLSGWGALIYATTVIALPRLARHGLIPVPGQTKEPEPVTMEPEPQNNGYMPYRPDFGPSSVASG